MEKGNESEFQTGDQVVVVFPPAAQGIRGIVAGQYGINEDIDRVTHTVLATTPWIQLMYTVKLENIKELHLAGQSELCLQSKRLAKWYQ